MAENQNPKQGWDPNQKQGQQGQPNQPRRDERPGQPPAADPHQNPRGTEQPGQTRNPNDRSKQGNQ